MSADTLYWFIIASDETTRRYFWGDKRVKVGDRVQVLDDEPDRRWKVEYVSSQAKTYTMLGEQRGWHVGGL